jgi:hypothetical protein
MNFSERPAITPLHRPQAGDEQAADAAAARFARRMRWLMAISGATTLIAIASVLGVIGYRLFKQDGHAAAGTPAEVTAFLPKGARILSTSVAEDRIVVTVEINGATEIRTFDVHTLGPAGRLRFATEP